MRSWSASSSSPSRTGTASWARIGPSSTSMVATWIVQPVTCTPAARASATAWAPRNDGSRLGWVLITVSGKATNIGSASTVMNPAMATRSTPWARSAPTMALVKATRSGRCSARSTTTVGMPAAAARSRAATPGRSVTTTATGRPASMIACRLVPLPEASTPSFTPVPIDCFLSDGLRSESPSTLKLACGPVSEIELSIDGHVAVITLAAHDRRNALTPSMAADLVAACEEVDSNAAVGAVGVTGGPYFCAGAHRDTLAGAGADPLGEPAHSNLGVVYRSFARGGELEPPTVAAIRGGAVGAGINLAFATDLRVIANDARLLAGFLRIGLHPGGGFFVLSGRTAGRETTAGLGLFGDEISGRRAADLGIAWEALPDGDVEARAMELATRAGADPELSRRPTRSFRQ